MIESYFDVVSYSLEFPCWNEICYGIVLGKWVDSVESGIPLTHLAMDPLRETSLNSCSNHYSSVALIYSSEEDVQPLELSWVGWKCGGHIVKVLSCVEDGVPPCSTWRASCFWQCVPHADSCCCAIQWHLLWACWDAFLWLWMVVWRSERVTQLHCGAVIVM